MFDFLNPKKRNILLEHPELGKPLLAGEIDKVTFIQNLRAFYADLCSKGLPEEKRFTKEEIERIIREVEGKDTNQELKILAQRLFNEAGFEIFHWAGGRADLNDWIPDMQCYIRAVHKLHGFSHHKELLEDYNIHKSYVIDSGIPFNLILPNFTVEKFQIFVKAPHGSRIESFLDKNWGLIASGHETADVFEINYYERRDSIFPNYIRCWLLCSEIEYDQQQKRVGMEKKEVIIPRKWIGKLGFKKTILVDAPKFISQKVVKRARTLSLNTIVETNDSSPAYLLEFLIQKFVPDDSKRSGSVPKLRVIAGKNLVEETVSYLLRHPEQYYDFIRAFIPENKFPHVYKGILSPPFLPTKGIVFQNFTNGQKIVVP